MTDWKRIKPVDDSECVMTPTAKGWTGTVLSKVRKLTKAGTRYGKPFGLIEVEVLESPIGSFETTVLVPHDEFTRALECFRKNEPFEFRGEFEQEKNDVRTRLLEVAK